MTFAYGRGIGPGVLRAYVGVDNLTDERYTASVFRNGVDGEYYEPGLPRNSSLGLTLHWQ